MTSLKRVPISPVFEFTRMLLWLLCFLLSGPSPILLAYQGQSASQQPQSRADQKFRFYRVPFENVTRLFAAGAELESLSFDEYADLVAQLDGSNSPEELRRRIAGSVTHEIEFSKGQLSVRSLFALAADSPSSRSVRPLPAWFSADDLQGSQFSIVNGDLLNFLDGVPAVDSRREAPAVRWSVTAAGAVVEDVLEFPFRSPAGLMTRTTLLAPALHTPFSDVGRWVKGPRVEGGSQAWTHIGPQPPQAIRLRIERSPNLPQEADFVASSRTTWTISQDQWVGRWKAEVQSFRTPPKFLAKVPEDVVVTASRIDGANSRFDRSGDDLSLPLDDIGADRFVVEVDMILPPAIADEPELPRVLPVQGRWLRNRVVIEDLRKNPVAVLERADGADVPFAMGLAGASGASPRILTFADDPERPPVKLIAAKPGGLPPDSLSGEYLIREKSRTCAIRMTFPSVDATESFAVRFDSEMKPSRIDAYRSAPDGARTKCEFEFTPDENGFRLTCLATDPSKGVLTIDALLTAPDESASGSHAIDVPRVSTTRRTPLVRSWTVRTQRSDIRLRAAPNPEIRWTSIESTTNQAQLATVFGADQESKPIAAWIAETPTDPALTLEVVPDVAASKAVDSIVLAMLETTRGRLHLFRIDPPGSAWKEGREIRDKPLIAEAFRAFRISQPQPSVNARSQRDAEEPAGPTYRVVSLTEPFSDDSLSEALLPLQNRKLLGLFMSDSETAIGSVAGNVAASQSNDDPNTLGKAASDFLASLPAIPRNVDTPQSVRRVVSTGPELVQAISEEIAAIALERSASSARSRPILTSRITLRSQLRQDGSAVHRIRTRVDRLRPIRIVLKPRENCRISEIRLDDRIVRSDDAAQNSDIVLEWPAASADSTFETTFETSADAFAHGEFPLFANFADSLTEWTIASDDSHWVLRQRIDPSKSDRVDDSRTNTRILTSFDALGTFELYRPNAFERLAMSRWPLLFGLWISLAAACLAVSRRDNMAKLAKAAFVLVTFGISAYVNDGSESLATAVAMLFASISYATYRLLTPLTVSASLSALCILVISNSAAAQEAKQNEPIRIVLPFAKIEDIFEPPGRVILQKSDLERIRTEVRTSVRNEIDERQVLTSARHKLEPAGAGSLRIESIYATIANVSGADDRSGDAVVVPMPLDDALSIRAFAGEAELAVRIDRIAKRLEIRLDKAFTGDLKVVKTFSNVDDSGIIEVAVLPAILAQFACGAFEAAPDESAWSANFGGEWTPLEPGLSKSCGLVREIRLTRDTEPSTEAAAAAELQSLTIVRTLDGIETIARVRDPALKERQLTLPPGTNFLDASGCAVAKIAPAGDSATPLRLRPTAERYEFRIFRPMRSATPIDYELMAFAPALGNRRTTLRLGMEGGVSGQWTILSQANDAVDPSPPSDVPPADPSTIIAKSIRIADWRSLRTRFAAGELPSPLVEAVLTVNDDAILGRFAIEIPTSSSQAVQERKVSFDPATILTDASGDSVLDRRPDPDKPGVWLIRFVGGKEGKATFVLKSRTKTTPQRVGETPAAEPPVPLPWPRFDEARSPAGKLIVERRIAPESPFRSSPMLLENASIESLGEIRSPDTPANMRQWLYAFRGGDAAPSVRWQTPGVFSVVGVLHDVCVDADRVRWISRISYEPTDGPLESIIVDLGKGSIADPILELDRPEDFQVERRDDRDSVRLRIVPKLCLFGVMSFLVRGEMLLTDSTRFELPKVSPLGHGRVDKQIKLKIPNRLSSRVESIEAIGLQENEQAPASTRDGPETRTWKYRASESSFVLRFADTSLNTVSTVDQSAKGSRTLHNIAVVPLDDGRVFWTATASAMSMNSPGIEWPNELDPFRAYDQSGNALDLERIEGRIRVVSNLQANQISTLLLQGHFRADQWPRWFETCVASVARDTGTASHLAIMDNHGVLRTDKLIASGLADWLLSNVSGTRTGMAARTDTDQSQPGSEMTSIPATLERLRYFLAERPADRGLSTAFDALRLDSAYSAKNSPATGIAADRAVRSVDELIASGPDQWRFYEFTVEARRPSFAKSALRTFDDGAWRIVFRRAVVAVFFTLAISSIAFPAIRRERQSDESAVAAD